MQWFRCSLLLASVALAIAGRSYAGLTTSLDLIFLVVATLLLHARIGLGLWLSVVYNVLAIIAAFRAFSDPEFRGAVAGTTFAIAFLASAAPLYALLVNIYFLPRTLSGPPADGAIIVRIPFEENEAAPPIMPPKAAL